MAGAAENGPFNSVLVIENRVDMRGVIRDSLKEIGFKKVIAASDVRDGWNTMQGEDRPDWIITCVEPKEKMNAFTLLSLAVEDPRFKNLRISIACTEDEQVYLPAAYEMGLFSHHVKPFTKASLMQDVSKLLQETPKDFTQHHQVATQYLRTYLSDAEDAETLITLEEAMIQQFPDQPENFLKLAEAQVLAEDTESAKQTLWQAKFLGADLEIGVKQLQDLVDSGADDEETSNEEFARAFGVEKVVVVDKDSTTSTQIKEALEAIGVQEVINFEDGQAASEYFEQEENIGVVIQEWGIPKVSGVALLQRIRQFGHMSTPIIVMSSLVKAEDANILKEMGVSSVIEKPFNNDLFLQKIMTILRQERFPSDAPVLERKIRLAISSNDKEEAQKLYNIFKGIKNVPQVARQIVDAEMAYLKGSYAKAKDLAMEAYRTEGEAVIILNLLGKIFLKLEDQPSALKCFDRAQQLSSQNLERLCVIAEAHSEAGDHSEAESAIDEAKQVDEDNKEVMTAEARVAINSGNKEKAKDVMMKLEAFSGVVAYMNNRAVTLVRQERVKDAIQLYKNALDAMPDDKKKEKTVVLYNMTLACARLNDLRAAKKYAEKIDPEDYPPIAPKVNSLTKRIENALEKGTKLVLNTGPSPSDDNQEEEDEESFQKPTALHLQPGDLCLHLIWQAGEHFNEEIELMLETRPRIGGQQQAS